MRLAICAAAVKAANARTVHFNVETKINPVPALASRTTTAAAFERIDDAVAGVHLRWYLSNSLLRSITATSGPECRP